MRDENRSPLHGVGLLTAVGLFTQILGFFYRIALSRLAGAEVMGLYQLIMPVYSVLLSLSAVGLTVAVSTRSAHYNALGDWDAVRRVLRRGLALFLTVFLPLGAGLILCSDAVSVYVLGDARTRLGLILLVPCVLLTGIENLHKHCFYGMGSVRSPAASETVEQLVRVSAVLGLLLTFLPRSEEETVGLIVAGMVLCEIFSVATLALLFRRRNRQMEKRGNSARITCRQLLAVAVPVGCTSLLGTLMGSANSVLIPRQLVRGGMEPSAALSAFGVLCGMTIPLLALPTGLIGALGLTVTPGLARQAALGRWEEIRKTLDRVVRLVSFLMAPAMALLTVVGPDLGKLLFRNKQVGGFMLPLAAGTLLNCWQSVFAGALNGMGKQKEVARTAILCDAIQLAFTACTVSRWGLGGFVTGFVLTSLLGMICDLRTLCRTAKLHPRWRVWFLAPVLAAVLTGMWGRLLFRILTDGGVGHGAACLSVVVFGTVLYLAALLAQGIKRKSADG